MSSPSDDASMLLLLRDRILLRRKAKMIRGSFSKKIHSNGDLLDAKTIGDGVVRKKRSNRDKKQSRKVSRRERAEAEDRKTKPGIIYIGHIPHGFYEKEMRRYFSQFGRVLQLRLSRSYKTGRSRGYAFVRFQCEEVAQIAADTMNNYMMFGKLIKCQVIPGHRQMFRHSKRWDSEAKRQESMRLRYNKLQTVQTLEEYGKRLKNACRRERKRQRRIQAKGIQYQYPRLSQLAANEAWSVAPSHKKFYNPDSDRSDSEYES